MAFLVAILVFVFGDGEVGFEEGEIEGAEFCGNQVEEGFGGWGWDEEA